MPYDRRVANPDRDAALHRRGGVIALLAPLAEGYPGAFGLKDDCALFSPEPGTELVLKTDPIAEGVHFLPGDAPQDIAWKALAVNVSDLAAKGATPLGYLLALSFPDAPTAPGWLPSWKACAPRRRVSAAISSAATPTAGPGR